MHLISILLIVSNLFSAYVRPKEAAPRIATALGVGLLAWSPYESHLGFLGVLLGCWAFNAFVCGRRRLSLWFPALYATLIVFCLPLDYPGVAVVFSSALALASYHLGRLSSDPEEKTQ